MDYSGVPGPRLLPSTSPLNLQSRRKIVSMSLPLALESAVLIQHIAFSNVFPIIRMLSRTRDISLGTHGACSSTPESDQVQIFLPLACLGSRGNMILPLQKQKTFLTI